MLFGNCLEIFGRCGLRVVGGREILHHGLECRVRVLILQVPQERAQHVQHIAAFLIHELVVGAGRFGGG